MFGAVQHVVVRDNPPGIAPVLNGDTAIRDFRPEDEGLFAAFLAGVSANDRRMRFFSPAPLSDRQIHTLTHFDPHQAAAVVAVSQDGCELYGVARLHRVEPGTGEFAVLVRSDLKGRGLGRLLLSRILAAAGRIDVEIIVGLILRENTGMLALARELNFALKADPSDVGLMRARLDLSARDRSPRAA